MTARPRNEYKVVNLGGIPTTDFSVTAAQWEQAINELAAEGWEPVTALSPGILLLERAHPADPGPPPPPQGGSTRPPPPGMRTG